VPFPDVLLLDEPTNHLIFRRSNVAGELVTANIPAPINWFLPWPRFPRTAFCSQYCFICYKKGLVLYKGTLFNYERQRANTLLHNKPTWKTRLEKNRAHLQQYVDRFRFKADKAQQAQSPLKKLEKMEESSVCSYRLLNFSSPSCPRKKPQQLLINLSQADLGYTSEIRPQRQFSWATPISRLRVVSVLAYWGQNGAGKSTLNKIHCGWN